MQKGPKYNTLSADWRNKVDKHKKHWNKVCTNNTKQIIENKLILK